MHILGHVAQLQCPWLSQAYIGIDSSMALYKVTDLIKKTILKINKIINKLCCFLRDKSKGLF